MSVHTYALDESSNKSFKDLTQNTATRVKDRDSFDRQMLQNAQVALNYLTEPLSKFNRRYFTQEADAKHNNSYQHMIRGELAGGPIGTGTSQTAGSHPVSWQSGYRTIVPVYAGQNPGLVTSTLLGRTHATTAYIASGITSAQMALLVPKIRVYKVDYKVDEKGKLLLENNAPVVARSREILFDDVSTKVGIEELILGRGKIGATGIKSFEWALKGVNPAEVDNNIEATLNIYFNDVSDILLDSTRTASPSAGQPGVASFLDLIVFSPPPSLTTEDTGGGARCPEQEYRGEFFEIRVDVGWAPPPEAIVGPRKLFTKQQQIAISEMNQSLYLQLTDHEFDFKEDGSATLQANYRARSSLADPRYDILLLSEDESLKLKKEQIKAQREGLAARREAGATEAEADADIKALEDLEKGEAQILQASYKKIVEELITKHVYTTKIPYQLLLRYNPSDIYIPGAPFQVDVTGAGVDAVGHRGGVGGFDPFTLHRGPTYLDQVGIGPALTGQNLAEAQWTDNEPGTTGHGARRGRRYDAFDSNEYFSTLFSTVGLDSVYTNDPINTQFIQSIASVYNYNPQDPDNPNLSVDVRNTGKKAVVTVEGPGSLTVPSIAVGLFAAGPAADYSTVAGVIAEVSDPTSDTLVGPDPLSAEPDTGGANSVNQDFMYDTTDSHHGILGAANALAHRDQRSLTKGLMLADGSFAVERTSATDEHATDEHGAVVQYFYFGDILEVFLSKTAITTDIARGNRGFIVTSFEFINPFKLNALIAPQKTGHGDVEMKFGGGFTYEALKCGIAGLERRQIEMISSKVNLANVAIEVSLFLRFLQEKIIRPKRTVYFLEEFIGDIVNEFIKPILSGNGIAGPRAVAPVSMVSNISTTNKVPFFRNTRSTQTLERFELAPSPGLVESIGAYAVGYRGGGRVLGPAEEHKLSPVYDFINNVGSGFGSDFTIVTNLEDLHYKARLIPQPIFYTENTPTEESAEVKIISVQSLFDSYDGDYNSNIEKGIPNFIVGLDRGSLKSANFARVDQPFLRESRAAKSRTAGVSQLRELYNVTLELYGNVLLYPGQMVYVEPNPIIFGSPVDMDSIARQLGLGGYHLVVDVSNEISKDGWTTTIKALHVSMPATTSRRGRIALAGTFN